MLINLKVVAAINNYAESILDMNEGLSIKGSVRETNIPIPCRVKLHERQSGRLLFEKQTDEDGNYEFTHLKLNKFYVVAHHPLNQYNAVIADLVVPK